MRLLAEAVDHRKAQAGALANGLGGEKRIEGPADHRLRHAAAIVTDAQHHVVTRQKVFVGIGERRVQLLIGSLEHQCAAVRHGIAGVEHQVEQGVFQLVGVGFSGPQITGKTQLQVDALVDAALEQFVHRIDQMVHIDRLGVQRLTP
ncbi:hypothetical protein ALP75_201950 [Pseudomonas syringae pv. actinidiae]|nr:hypothetical protein ALP75_201950 [Pseudomonas syringae pv. actinidiae]